MRIFILFLLLLFFTIADLAAQSFSIKGKVTDAASGKTIAGASVFLSNTSYGTISSGNGYFELAGIKQGKYDLVISYIGYETHSQSLQVNNSVEMSTIAIKEKPAELQEVIVSSYEKNGWEKYGRFFLENFIGTSALAASCRIKNTAVIKFSYNRKTNELHAYAYEPLLIENNALGYAIKYQLEAFTYNYSTNYLFFAGYPLFTGMSGNKSKQKRWQKARLEAYNVSAMRFMRSLYRNRLKEDGYDIYALERLPNTEKQRLKQQKKKYYDTVSRKNIIRNYEETLPADSIAYFKKIMNQKDPIEIIHAGNIQGNQIAYGEDSITAILDFRNYLIVRYPSQTNPPEYANQMQTSMREPVSSVITLINQMPVKVTSSGYYYDVRDLLTEGFWGWWEKLATLLPYDYTPSQPG